MTQHVELKFDETGRAAIVPGDPLFTAWENIKRDPHLKRTLDKLSVADLHGIMRHVYSPAPAGVEITEDMVERGRKALHALRYERLKRMFEGDKRALGEREPGDPPDMQEDARACLTAALASKDGEASK